MKTSNKLLLGLLLLVLLASLLVALTFRKNIVGGRFERISFGETVSYPIEVNKQVKTVKIISDQPGKLSCNLQSSSSEGIRYSHNDTFRNGKDTLQVFQRADTLFIAYGESRPYVAGWDREAGRVTWISRPIFVDLYLPAFQNLIVESATVIIDSLNRPVTIKLSNEGELLLAETGRKTYESQWAKDAGKPMVDSVFSGDFQHLEIQADHGRVAIGKYAWIHNLKLKMSKRSYLEVDDEARIDHLHAQLSDSTSIIVSPGKIQELAEMISGERNRLKSN